MMIGLVGSSASCGKFWPFLDVLCTDAATSKESASEARPPPYFPDTSLGQTLCGQ